jgi:CHAD domain-containing protein
MPPSRKTASKAAVRTERAPRQRRIPVPRLGAGTACDTAFRVVVRRCLGELTKNHEATCKGDPTALHQMRIALTRLRTAILFFSPMVADSRQAQIRAELNWLNGHLGAVRDLDVAIEQLKAANKRRPRAVPCYRSWTAKRTGARRLLARTLRSARYRLLVKSTSDWAENGPWSVKPGSAAGLERATPIATYSMNTLTGWEEKLLKKSRKLHDMSAKKRHRLRLLNKKLCYSIESLKELFPDKRFSRQQIALKYLRKAQKSLGQLNDDANSQSLAAALRRDGVKVPLGFLSPKREKRLLRTAATAYQKLAALEPSRA